jgi:riboflavin kinase / FMN adenylyltransferase
MYGSLSFADKYCVCTTYHRVVGLSTDFTGRALLGGRHASSRWSFLLRGHSRNGKVICRGIREGSTLMGLHDMDVITDLRAFPKSLLVPVMTIGNFDGVHLGHQAIFRSLCQRARVVGGSSIVLTFEPHPLKVLAPQHCPALITPTAKKLSIMQGCGLDMVVCLPFTQELANLTPVAFVEEILVGTIGIREIYVGYNFAFGKGRQGTIALLQELGGRYQFSVHIIEPIAVEGRVVSSSIIRQWVQQGSVDEAALLLGRLYSIAGTVVEGYQKGRELGFPTANVHSTYELIPGRGVYAVVVDWRGQPYEGVANIGFNPTFGRTQLSVEIHLFNFSQQLYGETVEVSFVKKIREERAFPSVADLVKQIGQDVEAAHTLLAAHRSHLSLSTS